MDLGINIATDKTEMDLGVIIKDEDLAMRAPLKADMSSDDDLLSSEGGDKQNKSSHRQTVLSVYDIDQDAEGDKKITEYSEEEDG